MSEPTNAAPENIDLVVPNEVAEHGGSGPAPLPHPLTEEANKEPAPGEVNEPEKHDPKKMHKAKKRVKKFSSL